MKDVSFPALRKRIAKMKEERESGNWTEEDEQILAFLQELLALRNFKFSFERDLDKSTKDIFKMFDNMRKEKGLLN